MSSTLRRVVFPDVVAVVADDNDDDDGEAAPFFGDITGWVTARLRMPYSLLKKRRSGGVSQLFCCCLVVGAHALQPTHIHTHTRLWRRDAGRGGQVSNDKQRGFSTNSSTGCANKGIIFGTGEVKVSYSFLSFFNQGRESAASPLFFSPLGLHVVLIRRKLTRQPMT